MIRMGENEDMGQLRVAGRIPNEFSDQTNAAKPFPSEEELLRSGKVRGFSAELSVRPFPGSIQPPPIPSLENEDVEIRRAQKRILWPHSQGFSLPIDQILRKQALPPRTSKRRIRGMNRAIRAAGGDLRTPTRSEAPAFAPFGPQIFGEQELAPQSLSGMGQIPDLLLNLITPKNAPAFILGGATLLGISSAEQLKGTFGRPILAGVGGIILGLGILPIVIKAVS